MIELMGNKYFETTFCINVIQNYIYDLKGVVVKIDYPNLNNPDVRKKFEKASTYALGFYNLI